MTSKMNTILIIGGTSGIGEQLARRLHAMGKTVIITGRRAPLLSALASALPGLHTIQWDVADLAGIPGQVAALLEAHPDLDSVLLNAGVQGYMTFMDATTSTDKGIEAEVVTNITAPMVLTRHLLPHLAGVAAKGCQAMLATTTSALGFLPMGYFPTYCATKAAMHSFVVSTRQNALAADETTRRNLNIVEIVPPFVDDTGLGMEHRETFLKTTGDKASVPLKLDEYVDSTMNDLGYLGEDGKMMKEITIGRSKVAVGMWRDGPGKVLAGLGLDC